MPLIPSVSSKVEVSTQTSDVAREERQRSLAFWHQWEGERRRSLSSAASWRWHTSPRAFQAAEKCEHGAFYYGFRDDHINEEIVEASRETSQLGLFFMVPRGRSVLHRQAANQIRVPQSIDDVPCVGESRRDFRATFSRWDPKSSQGAMPQPPYHPLRVPAIGEGRTKKLCDQARDNPRAFTRHVPYLATP